MILGMSPTQSSSIKAVVFDYGNVLSFAPTAEEWQKLADTVGRPLDDFRRDYWLYRDEYDRAGCGPVSYWQAVARRVLNPQTLGKLIEFDNRQWTRINPDMLALSRRLRSAGVTTAILSNMPLDKLAWMRKIPACHFINEFPVTVFSCDHHLVKPEPAIYRLCLDMLAKSPGECLFLDDVPVNVDGGRKAGMATYLFRTAAEAAPVLADAWGLPTSALVD